MHRHFLAALLLALVAGTVHAADSPIVGKWAADDRTKGGLGAQMIFKPDGAVTAIFGALVDFKYVADGKTLKTTFADDQANPQEQPYEIDGDKFILHLPDAKDREIRTRVGQSVPNAPPIVGIWTFKHYTGVPATWQYTTGGLAQLSVPMQTVKGRYTLDKDELTLEMEGSPASKQKIVLSGDHLTLQPEGDKQPRKFTRVVP